MGITSEGWLDWAVREIPPHHPQLGPKVYSQTNACNGFIPHSQEGYANSRNSRLFSLRTVIVNGALRYSDYAAGSWNVYLPKQGLAIQHYPFTASCWTSGGPYPNTHFSTCETEGMAGEPVTEDQYNNLLRILREHSQEYGWTPKRPVNPGDVGASLYEHTECVRWGSAATACPSNRIPWQRLLGDLQMPDPQKEVAILKINRELAMLCLTGQWQLVAAKLKYLGVK